MYSKCFIAGDNCVYVWDVTDINRWIDEYNRTPFLVKENCFWDWLSWNLGTNYYHFYGAAPSGVHTIKSMKGTESRNGKD